MATGAPYSEKVKREAIALARERGTTHAALETGIPRQTIHRWMKAAGVVSRDVTSRNARGHFNPGVSPNPGGRLKGHAEAKRLLTAAAPKAVQLLLYKLDKLHEAAQAGEDVDTKEALEVTGALLPWVLQKPKTVQEQRVTLNIEDLADHLAGGERRALDFEADLLSGLDGDGDEGEGMSA